MNPTAQQVSEEIKNVIEDRFGFTSEDEDILSDEFDSLDMYEILVHLESEFPHLGNLVDSYKFKGKTLAQISEEISDSVIE